MNQVKDDIHMLVEENAETLKSTINSAFVMIERLSADLTQVQIKLNDGPNHDEIHRKFSSTLQQEISAMKEALETQVQSRVDTLHTVIKDQHSSLKQKFAGAISAITGQEVNLDDDSI